MPEAPDLIRLRNEYAARLRRLESSDRYSPYNPAHLFLLQQRQREVLALLKHAGYEQLEHKRILELGCGKGGVLLEYLSWGAQACCLHGVDLLPGRLKEAHALLPHLPLACADGQSLPYPSGIFDLALQYTVFSSVLDDRVKKNMAQELVRVVRPGGLIVWYDFWLNPCNRQTRGVRPGEIVELFPGCRYKFHKITLAPPLARRLVNVSWLFCAFLEKLGIFNTHYLAAIGPVINVQI